MKKSIYILVLLSLVVSGINVTALNPLTNNNKYEYGQEIQTINQIDIYDMVIISPDVFIQELQPLIQHKNDYGVHTFSTQK